MRNDSIEQFYNNLMSQPKYQNTAQSLYQRSRKEKYNYLLDGLSKGAARDSRESLESLD